MYLFCEAVTTGGLLVQPLMTAANATMEHMTRYF